MSLVESTTAGHDLNRAERIGFWVYVAMATFLAAVVTATAMSALLG